MEPPVNGYSNYSFCFSLERLYLAITSLQNVVKSSLPLHKLIGYASNIFIVL